MTAADVLATEPPVLTETKGDVLVITLNRPSARNAIDGPLARELAAAIRALDGSPSLRAGVLTGAGRGFCAGMDLKAFAEHGLPTDVGDMIRNGADKPLVAAIEGFALAGGLELALVCDLIVASRGAIFGVPEVKVGLFAGGGALLRLPQRIPSGVALRMALTGEPITAVEAERHGLVSEVVADGDALRSALDLAQRIAANAPLAVAASKRIVRGVVGRTESEAWDWQQPLVDSVFASADAREGASAFTSRRPPTWTGQ